MSREITRLSAEDLRRQYATGELDPVAVTRAVLDRAERLEGRLNAFRLIDREAALRDAEASAERWRRHRPLSALDGVPISIKDIVAVKGTSTRSGSLTTDPDTISEEDCPSAARLREAGAVLFGKTHTPEFGWKGITDSPLHGATRNPWNTDHSPGGSSGGAGAAVAAGVGPLAHGTDAGGSIRIPASYCGLFGIKPTFGRVPHSPNESPYCTLASNGPIARTVRDAARMLTVLSQPDPRDWYASAPQGIDFETGLEQGVRGLRVAWSRDFGSTSPDPEVASLVEAAVRKLEALGAIVDDVGTVIDPLRPVFEDYWKAGFANTLRGIPEHRRELMDPGLRRLAEEGLSVGIESYYQAMAARARLGVRMEQFHQRYDLLITPTIPTTAPTADTVYHTAAYDRWEHAVPYTVPFNLTGQPAASIPVGLASNGLPVGMQLVAGRFREPMILRAARAYEQMAPFTATPPAADP
ncbi:MAG: amidase [Ectothiorhodospiraceae bacterium]|nr:amidase [Ectothiorhodospiraceae bacterium]MCH8505968.1 amidase [Ectothiorhodospiraceae bacterium]